MHCSAHNFIATSLAIYGPHLYVNLFMLVQFIKLYIEKRQDKELRGGWWWSIIGRQKVSMLWIKWIELHINICIRKYETMHDQAAIRFLSMNAVQNQFWNDFRFLNILIKHFFGLRSKISIYRPKTKTTESLNLFFRIGKSILFCRSMNKIRSRWVRKLSYMILKPFIISILKLLY